MLEEEKMYVRTALRIAEILLGKLERWRIEIEGDTHSAHLPGTPNFRVAARRAYKGFWTTMNVVDQMVTTKKAFGTNIGKECHDLCLELEALIKRVKSGPIRKFRGLTLSWGWKMGHFMAGRAFRQVSLSDQLGPENIASFSELYDDMRTWIETTRARFPDAANL